MSSDIDRDTDNLDRARAGALKRFNQANDDLWAVMSRLHGRGVLTDEEIRALHRERKKKRSINVWGYGPEEIDRLTARFEDLTDGLLAREEAEIEFDESLGVLPRIRSGTPMLDEYDPPEVKFKLPVGRSEQGGEMTDGQVRFALLTPVLTGARSPAECAELWRRTFRGESTEADIRITQFLPEIPKRSQERYWDLSTRSLERWHSKARATDIGSVDGTAPPLASVLRHKTTGQRPGGLKVDPSVVVHLFLEHPDWFATNVARHLRETLGIDVTDRRVQQLIKAIPDIDRMEKRGGMAAKDAWFRTRLLRDTRMPNSVWIMDHSWLKIDVVEQVPDGVVKEFDFKFEFAVETRKLGGEMVRRPAEGLWITAIIDACTRRIVNLRVWPASPNAHTNLLALAEAGAHFGLPQKLYTDNGGDFRSGVVRQALLEAGIMHVFSLPYSSEGRGKVERLFRTLKNSVLRELRGYTGGRHPHGFGLNDLLTLDEVQWQLRRYVEKVMNRRKHSQTGRIPAEHFDALIGMGRNVSAEHLLPLLMRRDRATKTGHGVRFQNGYYYNERMSVLPHGAEVVVHYDPFTLDWIHVSSPGPGGTLEYVGKFAHYDPESAPHVADVFQNEADFLSDLRAEEAEAEETVRREARLEQSRESGRALGRELAAQVTPALLAPGAASQNPDSDQPDLKETSRPDAGQVAELCEDDLEPAPDSLIIKPWM